MTYREIIRAPWWTYAVGAGLAALFCFTFAAVVGMPAATVLFVLILALLAWLIERRRLEVWVDDTQLRVGSFTIARDTIADATALDAEALRDVAGRDADTRARLVLRNLATPQGVKVDLLVSDPPYWLISSKHPQQFAQALNH